MVKISYLHIRLVAVTARRDREGMGGRAHISSRRTTGAGCRWNHNSAYYPELVSDAPGVPGRVCRHVVGVETDPAAARTAAGRVAGSGTVICGDFMAAQDLAPEEFETITCVACLHHMPLETALVRMAGLLVVGLSANRTVADWLLSALMVVPARVSGWLHHEGTYQGMRVARPRESLGEIRAVAGERLPGALVRRRLYWRYSLEWTKPLAVRP